MTPKEALEIINHPMRPENWDKQVEAYDVLKELVERSNKLEELVKLQDKIIHYWEHRFDYDNSVQQRNEIYLEVKKLKKELGL